MPLRRHGGGIRTGLPKIKYVRAFTVRGGGAERRALFAGNANRLYRLGLAL